MSLVDNLRYEPACCGLQEDAADEIERLQAKNDALCDFAQRVASLPAHGHYVSLIDEARAALEI